MTRTRFLRGPATAHTGQEVLYVLAGLPVGVLGFAYVLVALGVGAGLAVVFLGLPLIALTLLGARWFGAVHRVLAERLLGLDVGTPRLRPCHGFVDWLRVRLADPVGWRAVVFLVLKPVLAVLTLGLVAACWIGGLGLVAFSVWRMLLGDLWDKWPVLIVPGVVGLALLLAGPWVTHGMVVADRVLIYGLLGPTTLTERVRDLEHTRAHAVDDAATQLRRIERDLHDGTQTRLVALALKLGMAREEPDPGRARELLDTAHVHVKETLTELRDLIRGIHPPILDAGLPAAMESLLARTPIPVTLHIDLLDRPSPAIETITYYCTAELLTNVAKHANAQHTTVFLAQRHDRLRLRVADDGTGGARLDRGTGLSGLTQRVHTVDGRLAIHSPLGGPTTVTVDLPLHA
jgi:signal transduction histidine kinase